MASTGEVWKLGHRPALDGVRGIAVLLVLTTHLRIPGFADAPAVGVVMFFALSGFLITTLLLERDEPLTRFYLRRAARLLPAMGACLVLYATLTLTFAGTMRDAHLFVGAVTYTGNWMQAAGLYSPDSGIAHLWSLAVEEQFYLLWPVALLGLVRLPRRWQVLALTFGVVVGAAWRGHLFETAGYTRAYYGFDARADELLLGCLPAVWMHSQRARRVPGWLAWPPLVAAITLGWVGEPAAVTVVPTLVAALTVAVLFVCVNGGGPTWLATGWLRWVGRRSYAIYLYHLPVRWVVEQFAADWRVTAPVVAVVTLALAEVSWRLLEQPVLALSQRERPDTRSGDSGDREPGVAAGRAH